MIYGSHLFLPAWIVTNVLVWAGVHEEECPLVVTWGWDWFRSLYRLSSCSLICSLLSEFSLQYYRIWWQHDHLLLLGNLLQQLVHLVSSLVAYHVASNRSPWSSEAYDNGHTRFFLLFWLFFDLPFHDLSSHSPLMPKPNLWCSRMLWLSLFLLIIAFLLLSSCLEFANISWVTGNGSFPRILPVNSSRLLLKLVRNSNTLSFSIIFFCFTLHSTHL